MPAITMPQLGESVTEGTIGRWLKNPGDRVERDEPVVEIITDKVNAEIPSPSAGILERISVPEGTVVAVGQEIAFLATEAEARIPRGGSALAATATATINAEGRAEGATAEEVGESPRSSPLVRKLAKEHGLDLRLIHGTGLGGRVTREDVEAYLREHPAASAGGVTVASSAVNAAKATSVPAPTEKPNGERGETITPSPMRRTIAQRMVQSVHEIPHAWLMVEVDVTGLVKLRDAAKEQFKKRERVDLSYLPFVMQAVVEALRQFPVVNSSWQNDQIVAKREINLGVAVALDDGLVVPVIRNADQKSLVGLTHALAEIVGRARADKLAVGDLEGGTFTVNNVGAFGSIASQPIINYPQAAILNMETIVKRPVVIDDAIAIRSMMNVCMSFDHRIMDGATAGHFLQSVKKRLEGWSPGSSIW